MDGSRDPAIMLRSLRKTYRQVVALDALSLAVAPGSINGLLGPNGSGRQQRSASCPRRCGPTVARHWWPDWASPPHPAEVRRLIGFAGQFAAVDPNLTGRENLRLIGRLSRLPRPVARDRTDEALERFGLAEAAGRLVRGYSGGMRRRLDVAAALMHRPGVLFLDEPTAGLDPESRAQLWRLIAELAAQGTTVLLTTQYLEEADALADRVVIIDRGRLVGEGPPHELRKRIGAAVVALEFADEQAAVRAQHQLSTQFPASQRNGPTVRLTSKAGSSAVVGAARALIGADDPVAVQIREPSLDDVFLALTSSAARTGQQGDAP